MCCFSSSFSFHFCLMLMLYTERFYKKALHIFRFHEKKKKTRRTENRGKLGNIPFLCLVSSHAAFMLSHTLFSFVRIGKGSGKRGEQTRNANAHQHIETPCNKWRGSFARCLFLYICIYLDILTYVAEERKLKNT